MDDEFEYLPDPSAAKAERRSFLTAALATVTAAAMTGGAAALLLDGDEIRPQPQPQAQTPELSSSLPPTTPGAVADSIPLQARLAALEAENSNLQANLTAARRQLASYTSTNTDNSAGAEAEWQQKYQEASTEAAELAGQLGALHGLLILYEELEAADLATAATSGLAAVSGVLGGLVADLPAVTEGLQAGGRALDDFEEQLPLLEQGRDWLEGQMAIVGAALQAAETALSGAVQAGGSFLQLLNRWFEDILKWLPFGIGERALGIMTAVSGLLAEVPATLDGLQNNIADPLDMWLARDGDENRLQRRLIKPVRQDAIERAGATVDQMASVGERYETELREPVTILAERQRQLRSKIAAYRQEYNV